jgi:RHS repeat-associated protein
VKITYSDGTPTVTYGYDADGNVTSVTDGTGSRTFTYDADGELTQATVPGSGSFSYSYDGDGQVTSRTYPDGTAISYTYNGNEVASMTSGTATTTYGYDADGNLTSTSLPEGTTETRGYDNADELTSITDTTSAGAVIDADSLTLNLDGQPTQAATTQNGVAQPTWYYTYDSGGRLASACQTAGSPSGCSTGPGGGETAWTYDNAGNMLTQAVDGTTTTGSYNADEELTGTSNGSSTTTYGYDVDGDLTTITAPGGTTSYAYNGADELSQATTPGGGTWTYGYDAEGDLVTASLNGTTQQTTTWDPVNTLAQAAEQTTTGGTTDLTYNPNGTLNSLTSGSTTDTAVTDWLGSVTGLLSADESQVASTSYTPYGTPDTTGSPASPIGYADSLAVPGSGGLDNMHARDYNPSTTAFTSPDPLTELTSQPYVYTSDTPLSATDPSGLCSWYNIYCEGVLHWRGELQTAGYVAGAIALLACAAATDGVCALTLAIGGLDVPIGSIAADLLINETEGAFDYLIAGGCTAKTAGGLIAEAGDHGWLGVVEAVGEALLPLESEGAHAIPSNWLSTLRQFWPVK